MAKIQRLGVNSHERMTEVASGITEDVALPEGVILRDEDEMVIWRQFTRARVREDWRDFDLVIVAKAVRLESDIRKHQMVLDKTGPIIKNPKGTPIANPLFSIIDTLQRQQLALIRSLSLSQTYNDPRAMNSAGQAQTRMRETLKLLDSELIA